MMKVNISVICFLLLFLFSCGKEETQPAVEQPVLINKELKDGLPADRRQINGYLYAALYSYYNSSFGLDLFAAFNDPGKDLINTYNHYANTPVNFQTTGNVSVGLVNFNSFELDPNVLFNKSVSYVSNAGIFTATVFPSVNWKTEGNGSFKAFEQTIRAMPYIGFSQTTFSLSKSSGFSLDFAAVISNYDSVVVNISNLGQNPVQVQKGVAAPATSISFDSEELTELKTWNSSVILIYAFNYSNRIVENKVYVFELSYRFQSGIFINP